MKIIDKVKAFFGRAKVSIKSFPKRALAFLKRHSMMLIFIVGTSGWVFFFPKMDPDNSPHLFFLLVVAFLLGTMRDHEVWYRQRLKLEAELEFLRERMSKQVTTKVVRKKR